MSHNPGDAATTAREQENQQTPTPSVEPNTQDAQSAISEQQTGNTPTASAERQAELAQATGTHPSENPRDEEPRAQTGAASVAAQPPQATGTDNQAQAVDASEANAPAPAAPSSATPAQSAASATPQPTGEQSEGVANSANVDATAPAPEAGREQFEPRPDVSEQNYQELLPKLLALFNNNREQLGRALGLHRSTVDRWLNGKSRPNTSTILRMRRLAQERNIE